MSPVAETDFVPWRDLLRRAHLAPLALVCFGIWLHAADEMIVATTLPALVADIGGARWLAWNLALYEIGSIITGVTSARLAIRFGLRRPMTVAALLFATGCAVGAAAPDMATFLVGRLLQGLGGGGLVALAFVAVGILFPPRLMARAMATMSMLWGVSACLGPLVGGLFVEYVHWRAAWVAFAVQALLLAVLFAIGPVRGRARGEADGGGAPVLRLSVLALAILLVALAGSGLSLAVTIGCATAGLAALWLFRGLDAKAGTGRLLPRSPVGFGSPVGAAMLMVFAMSAATIGITVFGPVLMVALHGASPLATGYVVAAGAISWAVMAVLVSGAPAVDDGRNVAIGVVLIVLATVLFVPAMLHGPLWLVGIAAGLQGAGFGIAWTFIVRLSRSLTDADDAERVAGAIPTMQRVGYAVGAALLGIAANATGIAARMDAGTAAGIALAVFGLSVVPALLGLAATWRFVRARQRR
ncbi:MAG: MFS transporter [Pseudomonadota bacterium]|nr:MFS transporter [Pseudomonadota bacterium]